MYITAGVCDGLDVPKFVGLNHVQIWCGGPPPYVISLIAICMDLLREFSLPSLSHSLMLMLR